MARRVIKVDEPESWGTGSVFDRVRRPIKWLGERRLQPVRQHEGDAGFDLICAESWTIAPGEFVDIDCGIRLELPDGVWAMITGRSSTLRRRNLLVNQAIIDNGYRGPMFCGVWNLGREMVEVEKGERLAQLIPLPLVAAQLVPVQVRELGLSDRGTDGFGSTGP